MEISKEVDLESHPRLEHDPWLLDDHPLRSYPTECIPGLSTYLDESLGRRRAILFLVACLILAALVSRLFSVTIKNALSHETTNPHQPRTALNRDRMRYGGESWMRRRLNSYLNARWQAADRIRVMRTGPETFLQRLGLDESGTDRVLPIWAASSSVALSF
ncbi:uncharacterized protein N7515_007684 [Penicillium bovifimosum]|uniref:Uncharacterized protein n=1 Tax=Penicillium bovifimosum TaxID=126998 RepID=A0A9W9GLT7_9EURO|nr:uncharacterized protein N7515_007684 [Penicillium bovifimosum]KAJ5123859.1 hypothetical protein N7515_007684 [Penicillium bovifimosum]